MSKKPELLTVDNVYRLPPQPKALFDLDGTLTEPGEQLLMETFVRQVEIGSAEIRQKLINRFEGWNGDPLLYESYLQDIGKMWPRLFSEAIPKISQAEVMQYTYKWFEEEGVKEIMSYAPLMMDDLRLFKFCPALVTGAPWEVAAPFAEKLGIEYVFAMSADVGSDGHYTGKMRYAYNTGILSNKGAVCRAIGEDQVVAFGAGDTPSDKVLKETAIYSQNADDWEGRAYLMNPSTMVRAKVMAEARHHFDTGRIKIMEQSFTTEYIMEEFRDTLRHILIDNGRASSLKEIAKVS